MQLQQSIKLSYPQHQQKDLIIEFQPNNLTLRPNDFGVSRIKLTATHYAETDITHTVPITAAITFPLQVNIEKTLTGGNTGAMLKSIAKLSNNITEQKVVPTVNATRIREGLDQATNATLSNNITEQKAVLAGVTKPEPLSGDPFLSDSFLPEFVENMIELDSAQNNSIYTSIDKIARSYIIRFSIACNINTGTFRGLLESMGTAYSTYWRIVYCGFRWFDF